MDFTIERLKSDVDSTATHCRDVFVFGFENGDIYVGERLLHRCPGPIEALTTHDDSYIFAVSSGRVFIFQDWLANVKHFELCLSRVPNRCRHIVFLRDRHRLIVSLHNDNIVEVHVSLDAICESSVLTTLQSNGATIACCALYCSNRLDAISLLCRLISNREPALSQLEISNTCDGLTCRVDNASSCISATHDVIAIGTKSGLLNFFVAKRPTHPFCQITFPSSIDMILFHESHGFVFVASGGTLFICWPSVRD